jgi:hypothetical protein
MRAALLYILFVVFTLFIVSSVQSEKKQSFNVSASCLSIIANTHSDCVVPDLNFSIKKYFPAVKLAWILDEKLTGNTDCHNIKLSGSWLKLYKSKTPVLKTVKQKRFRTELNYTTEKEDNQHLS